MKVYVDELPERCLDCCLLSEGNFCNHDDFIGELHSVNVYKEKPKNCPLKLITDHDKQVRKEVVQEIRKWCDKNFNWVGDGTGYDGQDYSEMIGSNNTINKLREILDQIQGETK